MTSRSRRKENPLSMISLTGEFMQKGHHSETMQFLAALKRSQEWFQLGIVGAHPEERKFFTPYCSQSLYFRHYPETDERLFAGGCTCGHRFCLMCSFRRAYVTARSVMQHLQVLLDRCTDLRPVLLAGQGVCASEVSFSQYFQIVEHLVMQDCHERLYQKGVEGLVGCYGFAPCTDCGSLQAVFSQLLLVSKKQASSYQKSEDIFAELLQLFIGDAVNIDGVLSRGQQRDILQVLRGRQRFFAAGSLGFLLSCKIEFSADAVPEDLQEQVPNVEEYLWNRKKGVYELSQVVVGGETELPLANHVTPVARRTLVEKKRRLKRRKERFLSVMGL